MRWIKAIGFGAAVLFAMPAAAQAQGVDPAVQQVQNFYDVLIDAMKHAQALGVKGRYDKLKPAIAASFDLSAMLRAAVGSKWAGFSEAERKDLMAAFERKTVAEYASNFDGFDGEKFVVEPQTKDRGAEKMVMSKLIAGARTVTFNYRMRAVGGGWKVFDIYLEGFVSQLSLMRSQFAATLASGGAPALTKELNAKADQLLKGK